MMMKYKTSTKVSIIFSIFTFFIIFFILIFLYIFTFFSWYNKEKVELLGKINYEYSDIIEYKSEKNLWKENIVNELNKFWGPIWALKLTSQYKKVLLSIYKKEDNTYFLFLQKETTLGPIYISYDISSYVSNQINLMKIWLILLFLFTLLSFFISKFLFINLAFRDLFLVSDELKLINLNKIKSLNLTENEEINVIINSINSFLDIIDKNTKSLKQFNSWVSHEFKTPLMSISTELDYLYISWKDHSSYKKIEKQLWILNNLLDTFLYISKIENFDWNIKSDTVELNSIFLEKISYFKKIYSNKKVKVEINDKIIKLKVNKKLFDILISNLIDNAFKYNNDWWKIIINLAKDNFSIIDSWIWIDNKNIKNIFNSFYREDDSVKWYWIWLNISKKIIDLLDFKIYVTSEKWIGSEFKIYFKWDNHEIFKD